MGRSKLVDILNLKQRNTNLFTGFAGFGDSYGWQQTLGTYAWPLQLPAVAAAVTLLAGEMAALPIRVFRGSRYNRGPQVDANDRTARMLAESWSEDDTSFMARYRLFMGALLCGQSYAMVQRAGPDLIVLDPTQVTPQRTNGRRHYTVFDQGQDALDFLNNGQIEVERADMAAISFLPSLDGVQAASTLQTCSVAVKAAMASMEYAAEFFEEGAIPLLAVHANFQDESEKQGVREKIKDAIQYMTRSKTKVLPLPPDASITTISTDPQKAQLLETRKFAITEIARCFHIPPSFLQDLTHGTYSNTSQADMSLAKHTLRRWAEQVEQELTVALFGRFGDRFVEFDMSGLLRGDFKSRAEALRALVTTGIFTPDEARRDLGMADGPTEGSDQQFLQGAMLSLDQLAMETDASDGDMEDDEG